jgi:hypothetical protein
MKLIRHKRLISTILIALSLFVSASCAFALPPDPDNAALLYYQVFLIYERPDDTMQDMIGDLAIGRIGPDGRITKFIESQKAVIELAASAAELPDCHWGVKYSDGLDMQIAHLAQVRRLTFLILSDARVALKRSDYDLAIDRCLTARKLAVHVASEPTIINLVFRMSSLLRQSDLRRCDTSKRNWTKLTIDSYR